MFSLKQLVICATWVLALVGISLIGASSPDGEDKSPEDAAPVTTHDDLAAQADVEVATARAAESAPSRYPRYTTYPPDALPIEKWLYEMLDKPVSLAYPGPNVPLKDILRDIENQMSEAYGKQDDGSQFRMVFRPDYAELELDLDPQNPLEDVHIRQVVVENMTLRNALALIFEQTSDPITLDYVITNETMLITTNTLSNDTDAFATSRVYPVGHLLRLISFDYGRLNPRYRSMSDQDSSLTALQDLILGVTWSGHSWIHEGGEFGYLQLVGDNLVVCQTPAAHYEIVKLLNQLTATIENDGDGAPSINGGANR